MSCVSTAVWQKAVYIETELKYNNGRN